MSAPLFWGHHGVDPGGAYDDGGWLISGESEDLMHQQPAPPLAAGLRGSASTFPQVLDARSEVGPAFDHVIRNRPRPTRAEMPAGWTWLCGPA